MKPHHGVDVGCRARTPTNPFATRWTRPGRVAPRDAGGRPLDVAGLVRRFHALGTSAAVEGRHGSGKTNLLTALAAVLHRDGLLSAWLRVRGRRDTATAVRLVHLAGPGTTVCIDGWEALGSLPGRFLHGLSRLRRCRLLVTSHRPTAMPLLWRCETSPDLLASVVDSLPDHAGTITGTDIQAAFSHHDGNVREALFSLYDLFESRRVDARPAVMPP